MERKTATRNHSGGPQIQRILDQVDEQEQNIPAKNRRAHTRHTYRHAPISVRVTQPGGGVFELDVAGRELSAGGMSFLYRGFLHAGTGVRVNLHRRTGGQESVDTSVVWCRHIVGPHHLVGVKFRQKVSPSLFIESAADDPDDGPAVDVTQLRGSLLVVDDQELDRMLLEHHIKGTAMKVTSVGNMESALAAVKHSRFDLVLCDLNLGSANGEELIHQLRKQGYQKPIVAVTADGSEARVRSAQAAGAQSVVLKPYDPKVLLTMLAGLIEKPDPGDDDQPVYSELSGSPGADALVNHYIEKVRVLTTDLQEATQAGNLEGVRRVAQTLKGNGGGFGFHVLSASAKAVLDSLDASKSIESSLTELRRLESICSRLKPGQAPASK